MAAKIDPRLSEAIKGGQGSIQAVVTVKPRTSGAILSGEQTETRVKQLLDSAQSKTHLEPDAVVVFKNMQAFSIQAAPELIKALIRGPGIAEASFNGWAAAKR